MLSPSYSLCDVSSVFSARTDKYDLIFSAFAIHLETYKYVTS